MVTCLHVAQELRWQNEAEEDVDREHEDEVWKALAKRRATIVNPSSAAALLISRVYAAASGTLEQIVPGVWFREGVPISRAPSGPDRTARMNSSAQYRTRAVKSREF